MTVFRYADSLVLACLYSFSNIVMTLYLVNALLNQHINA